MTTCKICNKEFNTIGKHVFQSHRISIKDYYDKYMKDENEGRCSVCGNPTNYKGFGYHKTCSSSCAQLDPETKTKIEKTNIERYGVSSSNQNENIKQKKVDTYIKNFGTTNNFKALDFKDRVKTIIIDKYGVDNISRSNTIQTKRKQRHLSSFNNKVRGFLDSIDLELIDQYQGNHMTELYRFRCKICNNEFESTWFNVQQQYALGRCKKCKPKLCGESKQEIELRQYIENLSINVVTGSRTIINPYEIDIFLPEFKLAIEYCGLFWHSEKNCINKDYHRIKLNLCKEKGIRLITIFEDEWIYKKDIVKSRIRNLLGLIQNKIHARKCEIVEIDSKTKNKFLDENHIQGHDISKINLALKYDNKIVSVMTFSKPSLAKGHKKTKDNVYELSRFCSLIDYVIVGASSKLLSYFIKKYNPDSIYTYADLRWSDGNVYRKLNMNYLYTTDPNYYYVGNSIIGREHRFKHRKRKDEPKDITEQELRAKDGLFRIWDCGHMKFELLPRTYLKP